MNFAGEFETHVTIAIEVDSTIESLAAWAERRGYKFTHILLQEGRSPSQPMVTRTGTGTLDSELKVATSLIGELGSFGYCVVRVKIEAAPWSVGVPDDDFSARTSHSGRYFEHHVKLLLEPEPDTAVLTGIARRHSAHLSRNARRVRADGRQERFVTQRCAAVGGHRAQRDLNDLLAALDAVGHVPLEIEREYVVYDSNLALDSGWIDPLSNLQSTLKLPPTFAAAAVPDGTVRRLVFDPALKHIPSAFRPGDPEFTDPADATRWQSARRRATDRVLTAIAESSWGRRLFLRGSRLLRAWIGDTAREPGDLDFVAVDSDLPRTDEWAVELLKGLSTTEGLQPHSAVSADIWTYERAQGRRLVIPWRVPDLPAGSVQVDVVFGEPVQEPPQRVSVATELGGELSVRAATPGQSLAWKLLWLVTDMHSQGKDLYDATLLAESTFLPRRLLEATFHAAGETRPLVSANELVRRWTTEWGWFQNEYPWVSGTEEEWRDRLERALRPTFSSCPQPVRSTLLDPAWRTDTAVALARGIESTADYQALPILADALEDAGCCEKEMLAHCRSCTEHSNNCWVTAWLLSGRADALSSSAADVGLR